MKPLHIVFFSLLLTSSLMGTENTSATTNEGIHEQRFITIGGIEQWVTITGSKRENPVVLFIHGGPGNPMSGLADAVYPGWEEDFTLVHYDQRGAGRTYGRNLPVEELTLEILNENELTLELLIADGVELSRYLIEYLDQDKLILTGTSWGSALAVSICQNAPDLFHAYVGLSQMVNFPENLAASYALVLARAQKEQDAPALETLASIGPPPWENPRNAGRLRRIIREYETAVTTAGPALAWGEIYETPAGRAAYYAGEEFSWVKFIGMKGNGFSNDVDLFSSDLTFDIPVVLIQGEEDLLTTPDLSRRFFDQIEAPKKEYRLIPHAGHDPNLVMLEEQLKVLRSLKLSLD